MRKRSIMPVAEWPAWKRFTIGVPVAIAAIFIVVGSIVIMAIHDAVISFWESDGWRVVAIVVLAIYSGNKEKEQHDLG